MHIRRNLAVLSITFVVMVMSLASTLRAQETGERWPRWWYGVYGGANFNMFSGAIHGLGAGTLATVADSTGFDAGSGLGLALGGILEYNSGGLLGGNLMVGYDNRSLGFETRQSLAEGTLVRRNEELDAHLAYVTIEPNVRLNLGNKFFHLMLGPSFRILVAKSFDYTFTDTAASNPVTTTTSGDFQNIRSLVIGGQAGLGYDIPLSDPSANTQMLLTPFAQFHFTQDLLDDPNGVNTMKVNSVRAGLQLKFGSMPADDKQPDTDPAAADFTVRAPNVVTDSRKLNETFPMRNYVFYDAGSTDLPARYKRVGSGDAFREDQLIKPSAETGAADAMQMRSRRQMEVYYNVVNVFGDRMRRNPSATLKLTGSANGDAGTGKKMAESMKEYLVTTFGIDAARVSVAGAAMPTHKSGSGSSQGEDKRLIEAENYRVEIEGTPADVMQPVTINSIQEEPLDNDVIFAIPERNDIAFWTVTVTDREGNVQNLGPYRGTTTARVDSKGMLGTRREGRYTAKITMTTKDNKTIESPEREFRLVRADDDEEQTGTRYSILFEFDDSKTVQTYENFLVNTVAPAIPNGASVIVHGHTDVTGDPDYNQKLSQRRSEEVQKILTRELTKAGKSVTFDTYGFGEDERRSPFNNNLPEQRYYNRTVVIEIVPGR